MANPVSDADYETLARFRFELRRFLRFSEQAAQAAGLTGPQHQALLAIRAAPGATMRVGELAERLLLRPHSASGLVDRLEKLELVRRDTAADRRQVALALTPRADALLASLSATHRAELRRLQPLLARLASLQA